ncbi:MAG: hypothetical protein RL637_21, partial [Pseudomonadota bacterium]
FATTDLEKTYRINLNMIGLDGRPQVKNLKQILTEWLAFRRIVLQNRLQQQLEKIQCRLHNLQGLLIAYLNLDQVIQIIRETESPKIELKTLFHLTEAQVTTILELKLRQLAKLEEIQIQREQKQLKQEVNQLEKILSTPLLLTQLIQQELIEQAKLHHQPRRSLLVNRKVAQAFETNNTMVNEPITIILSQKGWIRAAKGYEIELANITYRSGDSYLQSIKGRTILPIYLFDSTGRVYTLNSHDLPSIRSQGEPLTGRLNPPSGATFTQLITGEMNDEYLLASDLGYGFLVKIKDLSSKNKTGKAVVSLFNQQQLLPPVLIPSLTQWIAVATLQGRLLIFSIVRLPQLAKGKGNQMIQIETNEFKSQQDKVVAITALSATDHLQIISGKHFLILKQKEWAFYQGDRAKRGTLLPKGFQRVESLQSISQF